MCILPSIPSVACGLVLSSSSPGVGLHANQLLLLPLRVPSHVAAGVLLELARRAAELVGDAGLEGVVRVGLGEELADGVEDGADAARGLPVLGLEHAEADGARAVVGHVGVVDARREGDLRRLEGVVGREDDGEGEEAAGVRASRGAGELDGPRVQVGFGGEGYGHACWGGGHALLQFLWRLG